MKYLIVVLPIFLLLNCSKQKEQLQNLNSDSKQINSQTIYQYTFNSSGKIERKKSITYLYFKGVLSDSLISEAKFFYNSKGLIIRIEEEEEKQYRLYNDIDSLVAQYSINSHGDTVDSQKYSYVRGKIKCYISRYLFPRLNEVDITKTDLGNYDTAYNRFDYEYPSDTLEISFNRDIKNELIGELHVIYRKGKKAKATQYNFLGTQRYINTITYYDDSSDLKNPDFIVLNPSGGKTGLQKTVLKDSVRVVATYHAELGAYDYSYYNTKNQLIKWVIDNPSGKKREIHSYIYDSKGNLIEETHFTEKISEGSELP
jgi:hypothetical protein